MVDMSFLYNYRGTLYPINMALKDADESPSNITPLVDLCSQKIVHDSTATKHALTLIPQELFYSLMKAAVHLSKDRSIEVLVAQWPWTSLILRKFAPELFEEIGTLFNDAHLGDRMRRGVKYTTCLAHTFVECLKKRTPTRLRYLDLTGYPAAEVIVNYLASHVLLVYNEARQKDIIDMYNTVTQDLPDHLRNQYSIETTLPDDSIMVTLDAFIQNPDAHMELCRALKASKLEQSRFKLRLSRLDMTGLGVPRISVLLDEIDAEHLVGLCLQFNSLNFEGLLIISPGLKRFKNLVALDLSCNAINLVTQPKSVDSLGETFSHLPSLTRLDLSNGRTKNKLFKVLSRLPSPLQFLRICACGIGEGDLQYLAGSHHSKSLQELDISENNVKQHLSHLLQFLQSMAENLLFLEMEDCDFEESDFPEIFRCSGDLTRLKFWNMSRYSNLGGDALISSIPSLISMSSLMFLKISYPVECYISIDEDDMEEIEVEKNTFSARVCQQLKRACERIGRPYIKLAITS